MLIQPLGYGTQFNVILFVAGADPILGLGGIYDTGILLVSKIWTWHMETLVTHGLILHASVSHRELSLLEKS